VRWASPIATHILSSRANSRACPELAEGDPLPSDHRDRSRRHPRCGQESRKGRILNLLDLEDTSPSCAFAIERSRGVRFVPVPISERSVSWHDGSRKHPKTCFLTRLMTLLATAVLAAAVLFRFSHDYRITVCIVVSLAALTLVVRSLSTGKLVWALLFVGVLGIFTPFRSRQLSTVLVSILDLATLALFAVSPMMLRQSRASAVTVATPGKL
jgi:hypothetical protein